MSVALHWSYCQDDALDAYQRALEIYVRRIASIDPLTEVSWLKVVVKHEAMAIRRQRGELVAVEDIEADVNGRVDDSERSIDEVLAARERVGRSAEALRHLKRDEARALLLKAQGLSYREIGERLGWSYTKVNRCITEGRARFLKTYAAIEAGVECERFAPTLAALVAGTSSADALLALRPHIRHCATCRATVRDLHATRLGRLAVLWPIPAVIAPLRWAGARLRNRDVLDSTRPADLAATSEGGPTSALAHGSLHRAGDAVAGIKQHAVGAYVRAADPTPLAGVRPGTAVAAVAGCLALGGGTTLCVTEGVDPIAGLSRVVAPTRGAKQHQPPKRRLHPSPCPSPRRRFRHRSRPRRRRRQRHRCPRRRHNRRQSRPRFPSRRRSTSR